MAHGHTVQQISNRTLLTTIVIWIIGCAVSDIVLPFETFSDWFKSSFEYRLWNEHYDALFYIFICTIGGGVITFIILYLLYRFLELNTNHCTLQDILQLFYLIEY